MKRVYVAGPYNAPSVLPLLNNIRRGMRACSVLLQRGYAPFCPWLDFHFHLMLREDESLSIEQYYDYSIAWLLVSDCMLVLPGWETSKGTLQEIEIARTKTIPIHYSINDLLDVEKGK